MKLKCAAAALAFAILACSPAVKYKYGPPDSQAGVTCINECEAAKSECVSADVKRVKSCEKEARARAATCKYQLSWEPGDSPKLYECNPDLCLPDNKHCENDYRNCYGACGGRVTEVRPE